MSQPPVVTIKATYPGTSGASSFFDVSFLSDSVFGLNKVYDGWCGDREIQIDVYAAGGGQYATLNLQANVYSSYEFGSAFTAAFPSLQNLNNLDEVNWLLNQNFTNNGYTFGEVEAAVWQLLGDNWAASTSLGTKDPVKIAQLVSLASQHDGYVPDITDSDTSNDNITVILNPHKADGTVQQPILFQAKSAALGNYVWVDSNVNGVQDSGETGVQGVTVNLWRDTNNDHTLQSNEILKTTTTDTTGYYKFIGLTPGLDYQVQVVAPTGAVFTTQNALGSDVGNNVVLNDSNVDASGISGIAVLQVGEYNISIDAGVRPYGSISGNIHNDYDANGNFSAGDTLLAGSVVGLYHADGTTPVTDANNNPIIAIVGSDGHYSFSNLPFGDYVVKEENPPGYIDVTDKDGNANGSSFIAVSLSSATPHIDTRDFLDVTPASLSGYVYADANNDGVFQAGETPMVGATVTLTGTDSLGNPVTRTATTGMDGGYSFSGLRPGVYSVAETQPSAYLDGKDTAGSLGGGVSNDLISGVTLAAGDASTDNNFGELAPASLSGFVYADADNDGVKDSGETPISGVTVTLTGTDDLGNPVTRTATTGDDGGYRFDGLRPGVYSVSETQPSAYLDGKDTAGSLGGGVSNDLISGVTLAAGDASTDNNFGELAPASLSGFVYADADNDGVKDSGETPIAGVTVTLTGTDDLGNPVTRTATTAEDGGYRFDGLRPGVYSVAETQPDGWLDGKDTAGSLGGSVVNDLISGVTLAAGDNSTDNNFGELAPASLSGFVYADADNDGVKDSGETPIAGVTVTLTGTDDLGNPVTRSATTGDDGGYRFDGLRPGVYSVAETQPAAYLDGKDTAGSLGGGVSNDLISGVTLAAGDNSTDNNFGELAPASLSGFVYADADNDGVKDSGETPIAGVTVTLTGTDDLGNPVTRTATTAADGGYRFDGLRPGTYNVSETQPGSWLDGKDTAGSLGGSVTNDLISGITLAAGDNSVNNNFGELAPASLSGFVYADANNDGVKDSGETPIAGVTVTLTGTDDLGNPVTRTATTAEDGGYRFDGLRPGVYSVSETQPDTYLDGKDTAGSLGGTVSNDLISGVTLAAGDNSTDNNFGELAPASLSGFVYADANNDGVKDSGETPIAGVTVTLTGTDDLGNPVTRSATTGADGGYSFTGLRPGVYSVAETQPSAYLDGKDTAGSLGGSVANDLISGVTLKAGDASVSNNFGELQQVQSASIGDHVWSDCNGNGIQDGTEGGVAGITVKLLDANSQVVATQVTDANGNYLFSGLNAGAYSVAVVAPIGYQFTTQNQGTDDSKDSDVNANGLTVQTTLVAGENDLSWDAGLRLSSAVSAPAVEFNFNGSSAMDGTDGNIRTYTDASGLSVNVSAFSENKSTSAWATAWLGSFSGGLGVTDRAEGDGSGNVHTVDNTGGYDNYVMFEFNKTVILDKAYLGYVVNDSDLQVWIGNFTMPYTNHLTLSDSVLSGMGFTEVNATTLTTTRWADLNANNFAGNVIVIAADTTDTSPEDMFKIQKLDVDTKICAPNPAHIGDRVWLDANANGVQDNGEAGIANVTVQLKDSTGTVVGTTTTDANGYYGFDVAPGSYSVAVVAPTGYTITGQNAGTDDTKDSDIGSNGQTGLYTLVAGQTDLSVDAGLVRQSAPVAQNSAVTGVEDTAYKFSLADFKSTDAVSSVTIKTLPVEGALQYYNGTSWVNVTAGQTISAADVTAGKLQFVPGLDDSSAPCDAAGVGNFKQDYAQFQFSVKDSAGLASGNAVMNVDITPVADAPTLTIQAASVATPPTSTGLTQQWYDNTTAVNTTTATNVLNVESSLQSATATSTTTATAVNVASLGTDDAYRFTGLTYLESGKTYTMSGYWDDTALIKLGGNVVLQKNFDSYGNYTATSFTASASGYYTVEMIAYNGAGAGSFNAKMSVNGGAAVDFNTSNFKLYKSVADIDAAGVAHGSLQANGDGGYYALGTTLNNGVKDTFINLSDVSASLKDTDGSETLSLSISAIPVGAVLTDGVNSFTATASAATATVTGWNLTNLSIKPTAGFTGSFDLQVSATSVENCNHDTASATGTITVNVTGTGTSSGATARIGDTVWEDNNYNGVQDSGEAGIAGVTVKLQDSAGNVLQTTSTDASGKYFFDAAAGGYKVQVVQPTGYYVTKQDQGADDGKDSDINSSGVSGLVTVTAGQQNLTVDAGLYRKASLGDKVWDDMNHNYVQDSSEPGIESIKVQLKDTAGAVLATTYTDANGNYLFSGLNPGNYVLTFDKANVMHYNYGAWYNMNDWKWAPKDTGTNDAIDSDVTGDGVSKTNVTSTGTITLTSGENDMTWDAGITPIVIDLGGDGVHSVSRQDSKGTFDLLGTGKAIQSGWLSSDDGFLAVDKNGNGNIDSIAELFGGNSKGAGFAQLASYDSNGDGVVDAHDEHFADLRIWQDKNGDHKTDSGELISLDQAGIASLKVSYTEQPFLDSNGNLHLERSSATLDNGKAVDMTDVYFNVSADDAHAAGVDFASLMDLLNVKAAQPTDADASATANADNAQVTASAGVDFNGIAYGGALGQPDLGVAVGLVGTQEYQLEFHY